MIQQPTFGEWAGVSHWGMVDPTGEGWSHAIFTLDPTYRTSEFNEGGGALPPWIARRRTGNSDGDLNFMEGLARDAYAQVFAPDRYGRQPWGSAGFPFDGAGEPNFFNTLPQVIVNGLPFFRTGERFGDFRARAEREFAPVLSKLPASVDDLYSPDWGYLVPVPVMAALAPIAMRIHASGGWTDALPMIFASIVTGAILGPALMSWAASGFDLTGLATEFASETIASEAAGATITEAGGGGMSIFDDLGDFSGWQEGDIYTIPDGGGLSDFYSELENYYTADEVPVTGTTPGSDAAYQWHDVSDAYGGTPPEPVTPEQLASKLTTADIEDREAGEAMRRLTQTLKTGGSGSSDLLKYFKDAAGAVYKLVVQKNAATGVNRVVPQQVRLPNGQYASVNAAGQIVGAASPSQTMLPYQLTGSQLTATLKQYALPIGLGIGALLFFTSRRNSL